MNTTPQPSRRAICATIHSSQHTRVVTNALPHSERREVSTQVTQLDIGWRAGDVQVRFFMREARLEVPAGHPVARGDKQRIGGRRA